MPQMPYKISNPYLLLLSLTILIITTTSIQIKQLNLQTLKQIRQSFDQIHNFIILDQQLIPHLTPSLPTNNKIQYFSYNCNKDSTLLTACTSSKHTPIILSYNKVIINYQIYINNLSYSQLTSTIIEWINLSLNAKSKKNTKEQQILNIIQEKGDIFIMVQNKTINQLEIGYNILAKQFAFKDFVYIDDLLYAQKLNLSQGDFVYIKNVYNTQSENQNENQNEDVNDAKDKQTLQNIIANNNYTKTLPKQLNKRYDMMRLFVLQNIFTRGLDSNLDQIAQSRFNKNIQIRQLNKQNKYQQKRIILIFCDLTKQCLKYWDRLDRQLIHVSKELLRKENIQFKRMFYRFQLIKNIQLLEVYYHIKIRNQKLPFTIIFDGIDPQTPYLPLRYLKQLSFKSQNPLQEIKQTVKNIDDKKYNKFVLTSGIPKKNGYTGKGSQKVIQKLSYETYKKVLTQAKNNKKFYLLYVTAFDFDCPQCLAFYSQFKKLASFLNADGKDNIVFGVYDLSKDQIDLKYLESVPAVLLFPPNHNQPIEFHNRFQFQALHRFLKTQIQKDKQRENSVKDEKKNVETNKQNKKQVIQEEL